MVRAAGCFRELAEAGVAEVMIRLPDPAPLERAAAVIADCR